jgi:hypothetical protein
MQVSDRGNEFELWPSHFLGPAVSDGYSLGGWPPASFGGRKMKSISVRKATSRNWWVDVKSEDTKQLEHVLSQMRCVRSFMRCQLETVRYNDITYSVALSYLYDEDELKHFEDGLTAAFLDYMNEEH